MNTNTIRIYNKELYEKLLRLHYTKEVMINGSPKKVERVVNKLNAKDANIQMIRNGQNIILRKPTNSRYNVYLKE